jgi:cytochrome P450
MLVQHPKWLQSVLDEIKTFDKRHSLLYTERLDDYWLALTTLPVQHFEKDLETMDLCIDETIRLVHNSLLPRRNIGPDVVINGHLVKSGEFVFVPVAESHRDPALYDEPEKFKPGRDYLQFGKGSVPYLGWGYGKRHFIRSRICMLTWLVQVVTSVRDRGSDASQSRWS